MAQGVIAQPRVYWKSDTIMKMLLTKGIRKIAILTEL